jgi:hypothetical protein
MNVFKRLRKTPDTATVSAAAPRVGWLARTKATVQGGALLVAEGVGTLASAVGVPIAAVTGKVYLAVLIALFGLGCCLRFVRLRRTLRLPEGGSSPVSLAAPLWLSPAVGLLSAIEVALLVEVTRLPVRADQPGFDTANWWWVLAGFVVLFWVQRGWLGERLADKQTARR